jgi:hypothetical protein
VLLAIALISLSLTTTWRLATHSSNLPLWFMIYESVFRTLGNFCNQGTFLTIKVFTLLLNLAIYGSDLRLILQ